MVNQGLIGLSTSLKGEAESVNSDDEDGNQQSHNLRQKAEKDGSDPTVSR
jgi:hypothetical protein